MGLKGGVKTKLNNVLRTGKKAVRYMRQGVVGSKERKTCERHPEFKSILEEWEDSLAGWKNPYGLWLEADSWEKTKTEDYVKETTNPFAKEYTLFIGTDIIPATDWWKPVRLRMTEGAVVIYGDEDLYSPKTGRRAPYFKPDYSPETFLNTPYMGNFILIRNDAVNVYSENRFTPTDGIVYMDDFSEIYDFVKTILFDEGSAFPEIRDVSFDSDRMAKHIYKGVLHVPNVLSHRMNAYPVSLEDGVNICQHSLLTADEREALVSIIIPSKDHPDVLRICLKSIREKTAYSALEIIVVDNGSSDSARKTYEQLSKEYEFRYIYDSQPFNFSRMNNVGLNAATGELVLLLNDDTEVITSDWIKCMASYAMNPEVGAVGAKLLYAGTDKIQHVGVTNLAVGPAHKLLEYSDGESHYFGRNRFDINMLAVTGACLMVSREKLLRVGGLNEDLKVAYNDIDLCFKLIENGYRNVQCNSAVLYHYESLTRGADAVKSEKWERLLAEKAKLYELHPWAVDFDPYYNHNLIDNSSDYAPAVKNAAQNSEKFARFYGKVELPADDRVNVRGRIDRFSTQLRHKDGDTDYLWIEGWSFVKGEDNRRFRKTLVLSGKENREYELFDTYRKDVKDYYILPEHLDMCGFFFRFPLDSIKGEHWKVGILHTDLLDGRQFFVMTDTEIEI